MPRRSAVPGKLAGFARKVRGDLLETDLNRYQRLVDVIKSYDYSGLSDAELRLKSDDLQARARAGASDADLEVEAFAFVRDIPDIHAVAVGAKTREELLYDIALLEGGAPRHVLDVMAAKVGVQPRRLLIEEWCAGCGECVKACRYGAISLVPGPAGGNGRAVVDQSRCVLCGYCAAACRDFCIKVV